MKFLLARIFGKQVIGKDGDTTVIGYQWRGVIYITKITELSRKK